MVFVSVVRGKSIQLRKESSHSPFPRSTFLTASTQSTSSQYTCANLHQQLSYNLLNTSPLSDPLHSADSHSPILLPPSLHGSQCPRCPQRIFSVAVSMVGMPYGEALICCTTSFVTKKAFS